MKGKSELEIAAEKIERIVRRVFPGAKIEACQKSTAGPTNLSYHLSLANPTAELTFKVYLLQGPQGQPQKEAYALRRVAQHAGVTTPHLLHYDDSLVTFSKSYAILTRPSGHILKEILPEMARGGLETVGYEMGRYLAKLHTIPFARFGEYFAEDPLASERERAYTLARVNEGLERCQEDGLLDPGTCRELQRLFEEIDVFEREEPCFVHGDFHEGNVLVEEGVGGYHVAGFLNFECSSAWSPEWDMTHLFSRLFDDYPSLQEGFLAGYRAISPLPEDFWGRLELYQLILYIDSLWQSHRAGETERTDAYRERLKRFVESR
ncbi:MAG: phosphotransferase family protein [Anaerolineae bacterium]